MIIRPIKQEDNLAIGFIIQQVLREFKADKPGTAYFDEQLFELHTVFAASSACYWIIELEGKIVGGCGILPNQHLPAGYCELVKLYLLPEARGIGLGKILINQCLVSAKESGFSHVYLETLPELDKAIPLYEKMGFTYLASSLGETGHFGCSVWMVKEL